MIRGNGNLKVSATVIEEWKPGFPFPAGMTVKKVGNDRINNIKLK